MSKRERARPSRHRSWTYQRDVLRSPRRNGLLATVCGFLIALAFTLVGGGPVSAHTGFESSTPSDGVVVDEPVRLITVVFTGEATPVGDEFVALDAAGQLQAPASISTVDNKVFSITFDPPLAGGEIGLRWNVQAADAHPIEGAFAFTVNAPAPTTTPATAAAPPTTVAATGTDLETNVAAADESSGVRGAGASPSLDEFLEVDTSQPGETTSTIGRVVGFLGVALGLGVLVFAATTLRGSRAEIFNILWAARALGLVIALGSLIEYVGVARIGGDSLGSAWSTAPGFATVLRLVGGIGIAAGMGMTAGPARIQRPIRRPSVARSLSSAVIDAPRQRESDEAQSPLVRWTADATSWIAFAGVALVIASFWFDGHTVSKGFLPFHALVNSVHVAAGAVWAGGVVSMAVIVWARHRAGRPMRAVELVVRFSKVATIALGSVVAAGLLMAYLVLDSFGELTGTPWGQILLLKTAAVGLAMIGGAYNHFRLLPALEADPESPELRDELRSTITAEAITLVFVIVVTAWLVAAAS